jgi:hypothetical protein
MPNGSSIRRIGLDREPQNKGMKQTKPAQAMELRSLSPVFGGLLEVEGRLDLQRGMRGALPAETIEAEVVIRDPRSPIHHVLASVVVVVAVLALRVWLGPVPLSRPVLFVIGAFAVVSIGATAVRVPVWLRVGPSGVVFREWLRAGSFRWAEIDSFEVGNPSDPRFAYIVLHAAATQSRTAIQAPEFRSVSPSELVRTLRAKQSLHA